MNERPTELPSIALRRARREQKKAEMKEGIILFFTLLSWAILAWLGTWAAWLS